MSTISTPHGAANLGLPGSSKREHGRQPSCQASGPRGDTTQARHWRCPPRGQAVAELQHVRDSTNTGRQQETWPACGRTVRGEGPYVNLRTALYVFGRLTSREGSSGSDEIPEFISIITEATLNLWSRSTSTE